MCILIDIGFASNNELQDIKMMLIVIQSFGQY